MFASVSPASRPSGGTGWAAARRKPKAMMPPAREAPRSTCTALSVTSTNLLRYRGSPNKAGGMADRDWRSSAFVLTPSFRRILRMCVLTVSGAMVSLRLI